MGKVAVARVSSALLVAVSTRCIPCLWKGNITLLAMPGNGKPPMGKLGLLAQSVYPGLHGVPGELGVQLLRLYSVIRKDPGRLLRSPDHGLRGLAHLVERSRSVRHNDTSMS